MQKFKFLFFLFFACNQLFAQKTVYQSEKVFVHTDKDAYMPGDTIWLKVYAFDAGSHHISNLSNIAYLALSDSKNTISKFSKIQLKDGHGNSQIVLPKNITPGFLTLTAYTSFTRNFGDQYLFEKKIKVGNPLPIAAKSELKEGISFFPEGGTFVENLNCRMAVKISSKTKLPKTFEGKIEDSKGKQIATFYPDFQGIASFSIKPETNEEYFAVFSIAGKTYKEKLPKADQFGFVLSTDNVVLTEGILVDVHTNINEPQKLKIVAKQRGQILLELPFETQSSVYKFVLKNELILESGVVQVSVVDSEDKVLGERLVYFQKEEPIVPIIKNFKASVLPRGKMEFELNFGEGRVMSNSNLSVAITDVTMIPNPVKKIADMETYLVFDEDFVNRIPFLDTLQSFQSTVSKFFMDNLMMTQKWEKSKALVETLPEKEIEVKGKASAQNEMLKMYFSDAYGFSFKEIKTDSEGNFSVKGSWTDSVKVIVKNLQGINVQTHVDSLKLPESLKFAQKIVKVAPAKQIGQVPQKPLPAKTTTGSVALKEVVVTGQKNKDFKNDFRRRIYDWEADVELKITADLLKDSLQTIPFLERNLADFRMSSKNIYMIDGKWVPKEMLDLLNPINFVQIDLVNRIEKLKKFGEGTQNLVNILTLKGKDLESVFKSNAQVSWTGYTNPKQFSLPQYDQKYVNRGPDRRTTLYWNPNLKTDKNGKATIKFFNSDVSKKYMLTVYGTDGKGRLISYRGLLK
jgi:hypothetical protein